MKKCSLTLTEFLSSEFLKNVLKFTGVTTEFHVGDRDRLSLYKGTVTVKSYWDNGKQAESHRVTEKNFDNVKVCLKKHNKFYNGHLSSRYWLHFSGSKLEGVSFLIPNRCISENFNSYEFSIIEVGPVRGGEIISEGTRTITVGELSSLLDMLPADLQVSFTRKDDPFSTSFTVVSEWFSNKIE